MLDIAENNRFKCTECNTTIGKGDRFFRDSMSGYRSSHTVNICQRCIAKMFIQTKITKKELDILKKEIVAEAIIGDIDEDEQ